MHYKMYTIVFWQKCKLKLKKSYLFFGKNLDAFH